MWQSVMYSSALRQQKLRADWHERCLLSMFTLLTLSLSLRLLWNTKKGPQSPRGQLPHHAWQLGVYLRIRSEPTKVINILFRRQVSPQEIPSTQMTLVVLGCFSVVRWHHYSYKAEKLGGFNLGFSGRWMTVLLSGNWKSLHLPPKCHTKWWLSR